MRPTTSTMLQQNNNNNYPCLSGSTQEMLQKCSRASLPFPSRLELGLGDLPLIRGLRAWALCSKSRRKAGSLLGGGQAPTAPPVGRGSSTSCPRPADVYLSEEWGRMGYGLPLGLDARQAGIGALVTVATLKTSEGSGKTQTQCLFLRTEKGSCLYSTSKPSSGVTTSTASSVVGGWLRGKTGGGRDAPAGRRDSGPTPPAQTGANRVRVRSGRRWRKSGNTAGLEKTGVSRERQQRSREDPAVEERQEEQDKGGLDYKHFPSPQQDSRRVRCCHNASPKSCTQCGSRAQRKESQDDQEGGESPQRGLTGEAKGMKEEKGRLCKSPDLESNHRDGCEVEDMREAESNEGLQTQTSHSEDGEDVKTDTGSNDFIHSELSDDFKSGHNTVHVRNVGEEVAASVNGFSEMEDEEKFLVPSSCCEDSTPETSLPVGGNIADHEPEHLGKEADPGVMVSKLILQDEDNTVNENTLFKNEELQREEEESSPLRHRDPSEADGGNNCRTAESEQSDEEEKTEERLNPELQDEAGDGQGEVSYASKDGRRLEDDGQTSITHVEPDVADIACAGPSTSFALANPAPSLPPLGSMATGLPCLEAEKESEATAGDQEEGGQPGKRRNRRELEEQGEEERSSTVATEDRREEEVEEEEEEEDEFGVFMQAEGEPAWSEEFTMSASVPCGSRESVALGNHAITSESASCAPAWTDNPFHQPDDAWAAFPQDSLDEGRDVAEQWWPNSAVEERRDRLSSNQNLAAIFAEAFPPLPASPSSDPCDLSTVPTLTQLLRGTASQDQGLLDSFHDLNKMIGQRYKRANGVSRDLLLKTLHLEQPESRPAPWTSNRRLSPGLPSANQHAQNAAAKRRLSYDYNRNIME
ncbi:uncharacterized protein LOC114445548 [Parambassis ranga]|uniref:Uncharacterized protein LOC114445548 n=1 Tax=Parambassis ranga TaxID=210632 RepID=A0A6P7JHY0_9TELE|nr:uncharacterized protein LOC114445548 [Parambassis ranga]